MNRPWPLRCGLTCFISPTKRRIQFVDMLRVKDIALVQDAGMSSNEEQQVDSTMCTIFSAKNSTSSSHEKDLTVYENLRKKLGMPSAHLLVVCMAFLPKHVEGYLTGSVSTYYKGTTNEAERWSPSNFQAILSFVPICRIRTCTTGPPSRQTTKKL